VTGEWLDQLARTLVGAPRRAPVEAAADLAHDPQLSRRALLRTGAAGAFALASFGVLGREAASAATRGGDAAVSCPGGSRGGCYGRVDSNYRKFISGCDSLGDPGAKFSCYVGYTDARRSVRQECRSRCPKKKPPSSSGPPSGNAPPGPNPLPLPPPPPIPNCGHVDCVDGDVCCKAGSESVCCAIGCARGGSNGCCSSSSDC
jgi:hypothetical protein